MRQELPDGSIPLSEPAKLQPIIWTDPRDTERRAIRSRRSRPRPAVKSADARLTAVRAGGEDRHRSRRPTASAQCPVFQPLRSPGKAPLNERRPRTPSTVDKETSEYVSPYETFDPRLTRTGARLGTGAYMAPEQFRDPRSVDVRADIYAFGVVLFEMITGALPFNGRSLDALGHQHSQYKPASIVPSVHHRHAKLAKRVDEIVQRCLKKEPARAVPHRRRAADGAQANAGSVPAASDADANGLRPGHPGTASLRILSRPSGCPGDVCKAGSQASGG